MLSALVEISRGVDAGESPEFVYEMRLIVVAAVMGNLHPIDRVTIFQHLQRLLEFAYARKYFGRSANVLLKQINKVLMAVTNLVAKRSDGGAIGGISKMINRIIDARINLKTALSN